MARGFRFCSVRVPYESRPNALLVLSRYPFILEGSAKPTSEGVAYTMDLAALPEGDGPAAEEMVRREVERAVSLHEVKP